MIKFEVIILSTVVLIANVTKTDTITDTNDVLHEVNIRMFAAIDDLFIYLKINNNFTKSTKIEEFMSLQSFIQDALSKNHEAYKEIHNIIKTNVNNEIADGISSVNDVLDEMIRLHTVGKNDSIRNNTNMYLNKNVRYETKAALPNNITTRGSNTSLDHQGRRIFAGRETPIKRYPFIVSVHVAQRFVCAGSLLHESLALSAASCVMLTQQDPSAQVQIRIGSDYVTKMGSLVHIQEILYHPEFDRSTLANNLAFLRTKRALRFVQEKVVAIKYDKYDSAMLRGGKGIVILGWGRRRESEKENVEDRPLSRARLDVYDLEDCKYIYTRDYVTNNNFCAGFADRGDGACNHDGGGPAVAGSLLTGVISFGSPQCGRTDAPTVFTRLALYAVWIESVLDSVKIPKGPQTNPQTFEVPTSIEFGNGKTEEVNIESTDVENPRETLKKEFGLADILHGPIDKNDKKRIKNTSGLHPEIDRPRMPDQEYIEHTLPFNVDVMELPAISVKPTVPILKSEEIMTLVLDNEDIQDEQKENEAIPMMEDKSESKINSNKIMEMTTEMITVGTLAVYDDLEFECDPANATLTNTKDPKQTETNDIPTMGKSDGSGESNDKCGDGECQAEDQPENDNNPTSVDNNKQVVGEKAVIIMMDSGTTKRIDVDKTGDMYGKVVRVMKALVKAIDNNNNRKQ